MSSKLLSPNQLPIKVISTLRRFPIIFITEKGGVGSIGIFTKPQVMELNKYLINN